MPGRKRLRGASAKEQRQYEHILESAKEEGRYGKRAKEVAARTVMKQHGEEGHKPHRSSSSSSSRKKSAAASSRKSAGRSSTRKSSSRSSTHRSSSGRKRSASRSSTRK